jgi:hypothetical protein
MRGLLYLSLMFVGAACGGAGGGGDGDDAPPDPHAAAAPDAAAPALAFAHTFPDATVRAGEEQAGGCRSATIGNATELAINLVTLGQNEALRASSWYAVPEALFPGPDGEWPCSSRGFSGDAAIAGGGVLLYRQSVDATTENQQFAPGVAIRIPAGAKLVADIHRLNRDDGPITGRATIQLFSITDATTLLKPILVAYAGLELPPRTTSRFSGTCDVTADRVHYAQPNARDLATRVFAHVVGGPRDGTPLIDLAGPIPGGARGLSTSPPLDLTGATGIRFGCEYVNPRDQYVHFGLGDQEMCDVLAFVEAPAAATGVITSANAAGTDGDVLLYTGACTVTR